MQMWKALWIVSSWLNYILGYNIAIIAYMLGCDLSMKINNLIYFTFLTHLLSMSTQDITGRYNYSHNVLYIYIY